MNFMALQGILYILDTLIFRIAGLLSLLLLLLMIFFGPALLGGLLLESE